MRIRQALAVGLVTLAPALTGCLTHIRAVPKTHPPEVVMSATLDQLLSHVDTRFNEIQTLNATVEIVASEGGARQGQTAHTLRVIHIGRSTLLPYQQDIYDQNGYVVTQAFYSNYQTFGDIQFPMKIDIKRPQDQYGLAITITKVSLNQKLEDDQFELKFPEGVPVKTMN